MKRNPKGLELLVTDFRGLLDRHLKEKKVILWKMLKRFGGIEELMERTHKR